MARVMRFMRRFGGAAMALVVACGVTGCGGSGSSASHAGAGDEGGTSRPDASTPRVDSGPLLDAKSQEAAAPCGAKGPELCPNGATCASADDCTSAACESGQCVPASCALGVKNGSETDVNCGGPVCPACATGKACLLPRDCESQNCVSGTCAPPSCSPSCPTGNPCGAAGDCSTDICTNFACAAPSCAPGCADGNVCGAADECATGICTSGLCAPPSCSPACPDGNVCGAGADCASTVCTDGTCAAPTCAPTCADSHACGADGDCGSGICTSGACTPPSCSPSCPDGNVCGATGDCASGVCTNGTCAPPACSPTCPDDNVCGAPDDCGSQLCTNGTCAVPDCSPSCIQGDGCGAAGDCASGVCTSGVCFPPACAPSCLDQNVCGSPTDCASGVCENGKCAPPSCAPGCPEGNACGSDSDCASDVCTANLCAAPACSPSCADDSRCGVDGDCRSGYCSLVTFTCVDGQSCKGLVTPAVIMDITSPPTTNAAGEAVGTPDVNGAGQHAGLDTCGLGEANAVPANQKHESCCRSLLLPGSTTVRLDKYEVTAGRMRQFVESVNQQMLADAVHNPNGYEYDLRDWATSQVAANTPIGRALANTIPTAVLQFLPQTYYGALNIIEATGGTVMDTTYPSQLQGCFTADGAAGASTYWWPENAGDGVGLVQVDSPPRPYTQDYYDIKAMNCAPYYMYAAFCAWDGGYLPSYAEIVAAYGTGQYPWTTATGSGAPFEPNPYTLYSSGNPPAAGSGHKVGDPDIASFLETVNWDNDSWGGYPGLFYFWPNGGLSPTTMSTPPPEITSGLDYSSFIASPGRFPLDATRLTSASFGTSEAWFDLGANMMEAAAVSSPTAAGSAQFCDCGASNPGETSNCTCVDYKGTTSPGVVRGPATIPSDTWVGGSWEGHYTGSPEGGPPYFSSNYYSFPLFTQYGKYGFRCARPAE